MFDDASVQDKMLNHKIAVIKTDFCYVPPSTEFLEARTYVYQYRSMPS